MIDHCGCGAFNNAIAIAISMGIGLPTAVRGYTTGYCQRQQARKEQIKWSGPCVQVFGIYGTPGTCTLAAGSTFS